MGNQLGHISIYACCSPQGDKDSHGEKNILSCILFIAVVYSVIMDKKKYYFSRKKYVIFLEKNVFIIEKNMLFCLKNMSFLGKILHSYIEGMGGGHFVPCPSFALPIGQILN